MREIIKLLVIKILLEFSLSTNLVILECEEFALKKKSQRIFPNVINFDLFDIKKYSLAFVLMFEEKW